MVDGRISMLEHDIDEIVVCGGSIVVTVAIVLALSLFISFHMCVCVCVWYSECHVISSK